MEFIFGKASEADAYCRAQGWQRAMAKIAERANLTKCAVMEPGAIA
jgi:putative hemolysin